MTDQFNVRLRDGLGNQARVKAAELGCKPRDVIEEALIGHYGFTRRGIDVQGHPELPLTPVTSVTGGSPPKADAEALPASAKGGCSECGGNLSPTSLVDDVLVCDDCGAMWPKDRP